MQTNVRPVRSRYVSAALLLVGSMAAPAVEWYRSHIYPAGPPMPPLPLQTVDRLVINTANIKRTIAYGKCEDQGIREIFALLKTASVEEMWVFVPGKHQHDCRWIEIGRDIASRSEGTTIRVDRPYLTDLMVEHDEFHFYHFHPLAYFERCLPKADCDYLGLPRRADQISTEGLVTNLRYAMPSPEDIYFMMDVSWEFKRRGHRQGKIVNRVISPYGIVDYALTPEGEERFNYDRNLRTGGLYIALVAGNALLDENIEQIISAKPSSMNDALTLLVRSMNSRNLRVTFFPEKEYR